MLGEDEDWLHELSIDMFPEDGRLYVECGKVRCRNRLHRGRHRELETDHRRHASRRPRASQKTFNGISIPRCSPEAYDGHDKAPKSIKRRKRTTKFVP